MQLQLQLLSTYGAHDGALSYQLHTHHT